MKGIEGGITAAKGYKTGAVHSGIRASQSKKDLAVIVSDVPCQAAAVYTSNIVKAAPLHITREHLGDGTAQAIVINSGNANACAPRGEENALREAQAAAKLLGLKTEDVLVASTGVIGQELPIEVIETAMGQIVLTDDSADTAKAIMTTDTKMKQTAVEFELNGKTVHLGGIAKGSGMIHPNMGTMLCFVTTDAAISQSVLQQSLSKIVKKTFNRISVDGDTSTNDMCIVLANGLAGNEEITQQNDVFDQALESVMKDLAVMIASDGEGASRLIISTVVNAADETQAETLAMSVASSSLFKAAMFGSDANWGRVLCAMGYSGAKFDPEKVDVLFQSDAGTVEVAKNGRGLDFDEDLAKKILSRDQVQVVMNLHEGDVSVTCWGCDLTYDYVKINGDYRS
ncbi:bifunctional glutamate N-acetyltransferase/amino-acid acetyltransferase ArgJ [Faecalibaculum rodentium]|jgi:glutamate N-acetyltransferase/amino-acid N-acetyltransferase|uniref:Arginine biosynthesis bifunctional protein ArgJ n=3 Tax=Faecalibaculum rodentium TaxID=1702221 RepID=A0A140DTX5_9FIRM|nr:bifunctional glutamate N-acetyltransferase/amino-acid acetyltransferase ArgJ [Faecalibaculum rodentium]AMK54102.1 ornithine acetyltransferase [Faecalibaculum rodentium]